jgi:hypothetical protein
MNTALFPMSTVILLTIATSLATPQFGDTFKINTGGGKRQGGISLGDVIGSGVREGAKKDWDKTLESTKTMPAEDAWLLLQTKASETSFGEALWGFVGARDVDASKTRAKALEDIKKKVPPALPQDAVEGVARSLKDELVNKVVQQIDAKADHRLVLYGGPFKRLDPGRQREFNLPLETLNAALRHELATNEEIAKRFFFAASKTSDAEQLLKEALGPDFQKRFPKLNGRPLDFEPSAICVLSGAWTWSLEPTDSERLAPRLSVTAFVDLQNVQQRAFLANTKFSEVFVYHPTLGWITEGRSNALAPTGAGTSVAAPTSSK